MNTRTIFHTLLVTACVSVSACDTTSENDDGAGGDAATTGATTATKAASTSAGGPQCGDYASGFVVPACTDCAEASCCAELAACDADDTCPTSAALDACLDASCAAPCAPPASGVCGTSFTTNQPACDACVASACCTSVTACTGDAACNACLADASRPGCADDARIDAMKTCLAASCASACDG